MSQISGTWWEAVAPWDKWWANLNLMEVWRSALSWFLIGSAIMLCFPSIFHYTQHRQQFYSYCWENTVQERGNLFRFWSKVDQRELEKLRILARWQVCLSERVSCSVMFNSPGYSLHGIFQARILKCIAISFSRGFSWSRDLNWVCCIAGRLFFFFPFIFISWRLITLQYCSGFGHTVTWISHGFTCIPHPDPPSHIWVTREVSQFVRV